MELMLILLRIFGVWLLLLAMVAAVFYSYAKAIFSDGQVRGEWFSN